MTQLSPLGQAALAYAEIGWPVFPCRPLGKEPLAAAAPHGFKNATVDPATITRWWHRWPTANIAVACGTPGPDVLDIDTKDGRAGLELFRTAWRAGLVRGASATIRTPSGGLHMWFAGTNQRGGAVGRDKALELKAVGGYVLLPPSHVVCAEYSYDGVYEVIETSDHEEAIDWPAVRNLLDPAPIAPIRPARPRPHDGSVSPGDDYNRRANWSEILQPHDWTFAGQRGETGYWRRPGKREGVSATTNALGTDRLRNFSSSVPFGLESYSKFGAYALLEFGGDYASAARELRRLGYGTTAHRPVAA
ncbi:MAG TPA: bifunctional DNA primase/polymerase [Micromonosporaceae bacterium]|nr:bifunctional DNA primase/polymerase [Micromonosporaceae bacterium]